MRVPDDVYDPRAVTLLEAAIFSGALPQFKLDGSTKIDMRGMLPSVAEVYLLAVLNALQRRAGSLKHLGAPVTLLLPVYDPRNVFWPSYAVRDTEPEAEHGEGVGGSRESDSEGEDEACPTAKEATALGVVGASVGLQRRGLQRSFLFIITYCGTYAHPGTLRNLGIRFSGDASKGRVVLRPGELHRWLRDLRRVQQRVASPSRAPVTGFRGQGKQGRRLKNARVTLL